MSNTSSKTTEKTLLKATGAALIVTILSKILGFVRSVLIAGTFGSDAFTDVFFISSDFAINVTGAFTDALMTAFIAVYAAVKEKDGEEGCSKLSSKVMTLFAAFGVILCALINIFAKEISWVLAPAYTGEIANLLIKYMHIFSASFVFSALQAVNTAVLNANNRFVPGLLYGLFYNPFGIAAVLIFADRHGLTPVVYAYFIANVAHTIVIFVTSRKLYRFRLDFDVRDENVKKIGILALPIVISNMFVQMNAIVGEAICSYIGEGAASAYSYSHTLELFVSGTFATVVARVLLSTFSDLAAKDDKKELTKLLEKSCNIIVILLLPITLLTFVCAEDIVTMIYGRGAMTAEDIKQTAIALKGFAFGFPAIAVRDILIKLHSAYQQTKYPMYMQIFSVIINFAISIGTARYLGILGITLAASVSPLISAILLVRSSKKLLPEFRFFCDIKKLLLACAGVVLTGAFVFGIYKLGISSVFIRTVAELGGGCIVYYGFIYFMHGLDDLKDML